MAARLTAEQREIAKREKLETKLLAQMKKLAIKVKKKFPSYPVKYSPYEVTLCLGWDWDEKKVTARVAERAEKLFGKDGFVPGKVSKFCVAADVSGYKVHTLSFYETMPKPKA